MKKLKVGIIGHGFVGSATDWGFDNQVEKFIVDPKYNTDIKELSKFKPEVTFICVPTPMGINGEQDNSILLSVYDDLMKYVPDTLIVLKSTVLPDVVKELQIKSRKFIYNPEFLREKYAKEDFENSPMIIFGGNKNESQKLSLIYKKHSRCKTKKHIFLSAESASLVKYAINSFLATKVLFFNELFSIFEHLDTEDNWHDITNAVSEDIRIGASHMDVPGPDGRFGFGGACFPKDTTALISFCRENNINLTVLETTVKTNNSIRLKYVDIDSREKDQNIKFDF